MTTFCLYWAFSVFAAVLICLEYILAFGQAMALKVLLSNTEQSPIVQIFISGKDLGVIIWKDNLYVLFCRLFTLG